MTATDLLPVFLAAADAARDAVATLHGPARRARTDRPGQYALDLAADAAVLEVLHEAPVRVLSEESGWSGPPDAPVTVVVDPVDGSTNCSRHIPYWGVSLCALDGDGPLSALVVNTTTDEHYSATRGGGARSDGERLQVSSTTRPEDAVVAVTGLPRTRCWKQFRALGSAALALCDVAAGRLDAFLDVLEDQHAPWDYLGGLLVCQEAGATVVDVHARNLVVADPTARRQLLGAATPELLERLAPHAVA
jgi:fructose-1,6-bisphosphatase/inositol monophosphatase family enzyme